MSKLVKQNVNITLFKMAVPMLVGTVSVNLYNLTDTWFVSRLGTDPLAAMSFTFPVILTVHFIAQGLGTGALALAAHALGGKNRPRAAAVTTHALMLALVLSLAVSALGIWTVRPVFVMLGAEGDILEMVSYYMTVWYCGAGAAIVPMILNAVIMGTGDTKSAGLTMALGTVLNVILDPLLIFGRLGFPAMGMSGAALATVISQMFALVFSLYVLGKKHRLIVWREVALKPMLRSWGGILKIGVPSILSGLLTPISQGVITRIVAAFGPAAVAAIGAAGRLEMFAFMIPMSIGMSLVPFIAQNFGADRFDRIFEARKSTLRFALGFGVLIAGVFFVSAPFLSGLFSDDPKVIEVMVRYIRVICFGYGMTEAFRYSTFYLVGIHRPNDSAALNVIRNIVLLVPLAIAGSVLWGITGVFVGRLTADLLAGVIGIKYSKRVLFKVAAAS